MRSPSAIHALLLSSFLLLAADASAQDPEGFQFLPPGRLIAPLRSSVTEPRIGVFKFLDASTMKVDIGNAIDVFGYKAGAIALAAGIDFFAYAKTTGNEGLRLQIDALDGFFGGDLSADAPLSGEQRLQARLRILHQSAHLVDGHYSTESNSWIDGRQPIPFTRDFGEMTLLYLLGDTATCLRTYAGVTYATLVRPATLARFSYAAGAELYDGGLTGSVFGHPVEWFLAYHIVLAGVPAYSASHQIQGGVKFGTWYGAGPSIFVGYFRGMEMFSEYYNERLSTIGLGFSVDFR